MLFLPGVVLALVQVSALRGRDELLGRAAVIDVVRLAHAGRGYARGVMEIVVPRGVETAAAALPAPQEPRVLRLVLDDDRGAAAACRLAHPILALAKDMGFGSIEHLLGGTEPQAVDGKLVDPVARVREEEFPHRRGALAVEVEGL